MNYKNFANRTVRSIPAGATVAIGTALVFPDASGYTVAAAGVGGAILYGVAEWATEDPGQDLIDASRTEKAAAYFQKVETKAQAQPAQTQPAQAQPAPTGVTIDAEALKAFEAWKAQAAQEIVSATAELPKKPNAS